MKLRRMSLQTQPRKKRKSSGMTSGASGAATYAAGWMTNFTRISMSLFARLPPDRIILGGSGR